MSAAALPPGSVIGILGGGQLGRMLAIAAARLGLRVHIFDPDPGAVAAEVAGRHTVAAYDDFAALADFAAAVDVVTFEFENVPAATAEALAARAPVRPNPRSLAIAQDRVAEKRFLGELGLAVAPWSEIPSLTALETAREGPAILKTRRFGYDGKGQVRLDPGDSAAAAWAAIGGQPAVLEALVPFEAEISVIGARGLGGAVVCYDPGRNEHQGGILRRTTVPAAIPGRLRTDAVLATGRILGALEYVGVIGVEFFVTEGRLLVNEFAPRVHNSGHWTIEACVIDQFSQHIRAVAGWPLGNGQRHSDAEMTNLIGTEIEDWATLARGDTGLHLYGKTGARPGRKMGHVTRLIPRT